MLDQNTSDPVESIARTCCGGSGRHTNGCPEPAQGSAIATREAVAAYLRAARERAGLSQRQLASLMGYSVETVRAWEYRRKLPHVAMTFALAQHLPIPPLQVRALLLARLASELRDGHYPLSDELHELLAMADLIAVADEIDGEGAK